MQSSTTLSPELISAYEATNFHVMTDPAFILKIGINSNELEMLFNKSGHKTATFITACNPFSNTLSDEDNQLRNIQLEVDLGDLNVEIIDGFGQDLFGEWAGEASFLALGIDYDLASKLGIKYEQNAIVWCNADAVPQLILLR